MKSKQLWTIVGVSLVVAVVVTLVSGLVVQEPLLGPKTSANAYVKAHSCDADGTCEINDALVQGDLVVQGMFRQDCASFGNVVELGGEGTCRSKGYDYCLFSEKIEEVRYYDASSNNCNGGNVQSYFKETGLYRNPDGSLCPPPNERSTFSCMLNEDGGEPYFGEVSFNYDAGKIKLVCCR